MNIDIKKGYFSSDRKIFLKGNNTTTSVNVTDTDLRNNKNAIELSAE
jgi:hypothetical protein